MAARYVVGERVENLPVPTYGGKVWLVTGEVIRVEMLDFRWWAWIRADTGEEVRVPA